MCDCHETYGAHLRSKNLAIYGCRDTTGGRDLTWEKRNTSELEAYASARREGIEPGRTRMWAVDRARKWSDEHGVAYKPGMEYTHGSTK